MTLFPRKYFNFRGQVYTIEKRPDGIWRDAWGTEYSLSEDENSVDKINRYGIGIFSIPANHPASEAAAAHDHAYSSRVYQLYNTRKEADDALLESVRLTGNNLLARFGHLISRLFGRFFWERRETR